MTFNLEAFGRPVALVSITAPGAERLPWDEAHCMRCQPCKDAGVLGACPHRRPHKHAGTRGCRVRDRALREWCDTATLRLQWLRRAAYMATKRAGHAAPAWIERVWEPQRRGAPHVHVVVPCGTPRERRALTRYVHELKRLAAEYDFGFVDVTKAMSGAEAARYLSNYLTGRNGKRKNTIRENIADPRLPRSLIWLTPKLTRVTLVTMRRLRRARHLWAALDGICSPPRWADSLEAAKVALVFRRVFRRRGPSREGEPDAGEVLRLAEECERWVRRRAWSEQGEQRQLLAELVAAAA